MPSLWSVHTLFHFLWPWVQIFQGTGLMDLITMAHSESQATLRVLAWGKCPALVQLMTTPDQRMAPPFPQRGAKFQHPVTDSASTSLTDKGRRDHAPEEQGASPLSQNAERGKENAGLPCSCAVKAPGLVSDGALPRHPRAFYHCQERA